MNDFQDAPALRRLAAALWGQTGSGAAVLVGSGFSRQCERPHADGPSPPLWSDLTRAMADGLDRSGHDAIHAAPLRLAETYETIFGRAALVELVRRRVNDAAWRPGAAHMALLDLPWADVLTTNYDTLLERAATGSIRGYGIVRGEADLPGLRAPRIVKLHGTIEDGSSLVITEEDYRRYPDTQAAMVNTARQALIENDLCLLGFSGEDPNFRAWVGWVRDRLGGLERRVYLVGLLDLDPIERRVIEGLGVIPVDLSPMISGSKPDRHRAAANWLLEFLAGQAPKGPSDWKPLSAAELGHPSTSDEQQRIGKDRALLAENLRTVLRGWRRDRVAYPGWLVCPWAERFRLRFGTDAPLRLEQALDAVEAQEATAILLEIGWRHDTASDPLPSWIAKRLDRIAPTLTAAEDPELLLATISARLWAARVAGDLEEIIEEWGHLEGISDVPAIIAHARAHDAMDRLDFTAVAELTPELVGDDPIWHLRRAAILAWLGDEEDAHEVVRLAWTELLDRCRRMPQSVALRSRLAWVWFVADVVRRRREDDERYTIPERFRIEGYEPWGEIRHIDSETEKIERTSRDETEVEVQFRAGSYRRGNGMRLVSRAAALTPAGELTWLRERIGLPFGVRYANLLQTRTERAVVAAEDPSLSSISRVLAAAPDSKGPLLNKWLTRVGVAALEDDTARALAQRCEGAIAHWLGRMGEPKEAELTARDRLPILVETLARLAVRDKSDDAVRHAQLAFRISEIRGWHAFAKQTDHLIENAVDAMPPNERWRILPTVVRYPIPGERDDHYRDLSGIHAAFVESVSRPSEIADRIADVLAMLSAEDRCRAEAVHLLFTLHRIGALTADETERFGEGLWSDISSEGLPKGTTLYPDVFLQAPAPPDIDVEARLRAMIYDRDLASKAELVHRALAPTAGRLVPSSAEAARIFDELVPWRPEPRPPEQDAFEQAITGRSVEREWARDRKNVATSLGNVCWHLDAADRTPARATALMTFVRETGGQDALIGGLAFEERPEITRALRRLASSGAFEETFSYARAVVLAMQRQRSIPCELIEAAVTAVAFQPPGAVHVLLKLLDTLVRADLLGGEEASGLEVILDDLWARFDYETLAGAETSSQILISSSLTRAAAVRLADGLSKSGITGEAISNWCSRAAMDPLPEVRHALRSTDLRGE